MKSAPDVQTPSDIRRRLLHCLTPIFQKRGWAFGVDIVSTASWLQDKFSALGTNWCFAVILFARGS